MEFADQGRQHLLCSAACFGQSGAQLFASVALILVPLASIACSVTPQQREAKYMAKGKTYLASNDYKKAVIEFKVASQNMPKDAEPIYQLGMTYFRAGAARLALEAFEKATTLDPIHEGARYHVALFQVGSNSREQILAAEAVLKTYAAGHPNDAEAVGVLSLAEAKLGNKAEALKLLDTAVTRDPSHLRPASIVVAFYTARGDLGTAKEIALGIVRQLPDSPGAAILRAEVSLAMRDMADADAQIGRALALQPDFRPALELRLRRELMLRDRPGAEQTTEELANLPDKGTWSIHARILFAERKYDEGAAEFEQLLKKHSNAVEIRDEYSAMMMAAGRLKQAEVIVAGTLAKAPKDPAALLQRTTLEIDARNTDGAAKDIKALLEMKAFSAPLSYQQSRVAATRGDKVAQGSLLSDALRQNPRLLIARVDLASLLYNSGKGRDALSMLEQASPAEKATAEYLFHHNMALMALGDWEGARKGVDAGLARVRSPGFLYQDGRLRAMSHDLPGARKSLEASFQAQPSNSQTLSLLAEVARGQGDSQNFVAMLREAAAKNPGLVHLQTALGSQLAALGDHNGARAAYQAARAAGDVPGADVAIAQLEMQSGSLDAAKQRLTSLIKSHDNAGARILLAEIENRRGSPGNAIPHYLKAIEMEPTNVAAMNNLATVIPIGAPTNGDALFWAKKALALAPSNPILEDTIGWIYYRQGKYGDALPFLERSLRSLDRPIAHYHLGAALIKGGDGARGRREYDLAVKEAPQSSARAEVGPLFEGK
jgi:tetratricopeptide (TPR) repeat protein